MSGTDYERELKKLLEMDGYKVVRSAGSMGLGDLIAMRRENWSMGCTAHSYTRVIIIECKASKHVRFDIDNDNLRKQRDDLVALKMEGYEVFYAFRLKSRKHHPDIRDKWHFFEPYLHMKSFRWDQYHSTYQDEINRSVNQYG